jgi:DNA-binding transcriptional LysR family regulator
MHDIDLRRLDLNLLVTFEVLMTERSVTRAAERLNRTQSAVSHALARLREQVGDPLLVKMGGRMTPSPFAERLIDDVRPILRSIQRVLMPPQPFDAATSTRTFRIAVSDIAPTLFPRLMAAVSRSAPRVTVDWVTETPQTPLAVADGQIDVAFVASALKLPEGIAREEAGDIPWATFMRADHPARRAWNAAAWGRWPHVLVQIGNSLQSPVTAASTGAREQRHVAARVLNFSAVAPLLARTECVATLPAIVMHEALERFGLCALPPPFAVPSMPHRFIWSERLTNDPALAWLRRELLAAFAVVRRESSQQVPEKRVARRRPNQSASTRRPA